MACSPTTEATWAPNSVATPSPPTRSQAGRGLATAGCWRKPPDVPAVRGTATLQPQLNYSRRNDVLLLSQQLRVVLGVHAGADGRRTAKPDGPLARTAARHRAGARPRCVDQGMGF